MAIATAIPTKTTIVADKTVERYIAKAQRAGLPRDQIRSFVEGGYVALDGMLPFHAACRDADKPGGPEYIALGGKRGPGKSHTVLSQVGVDDCQRIDGLKFLFLRKIQKSASESLDDLVMACFRYLPYHFAANKVTFGNGSRIIVGGFKNERDIDKYLGIQYDGIVLEEATQLSEKKKTQLRGSLRTSKPGWRPRMYFSTNADGIGLKWFKEMFVTPSRLGPKIERRNGTRFFDVTHISNPFVNPEYQAWLDGLKGSLAKAWKEGDWDAFAGMAFPTWNHEHHVVEPFEIPETWVKWRGVDWGSAAPWCCLWGAKDPDTSRIYIYREAYQAGLTTVKQRERINDMTPPDEIINVNYADPAMWSRQNRNNEIYTAFDEYKDPSLTDSPPILLKKADNDRLSGKRKVDRVLDNLPDGKPGLQVVSTCYNLIEQFESLARDDLRPEDVDTDQEDHAYDALRYFMTNEKAVETNKPKRRPNPMKNVAGI